jgi:hypothetical protein
MPELPFRRTVLILTVAGLIGAVAGAVVSANLPSRFMSTAVVRIAPTQSMRSLTAHAMNRRSLVEIIQREKLYSLERQRLPMEDVLTRMQTCISVQSVNNADLYNVNFVYEDAVKAQQGNRALVAQMSDRGLTVIQPPTMPDHNLELTRVQVSCIAISGSVLLVFFLIVLRRSSQARTLTLSAVAGGLVGFAISLFIPATYTSTSRIAVTDVLPVDRVTASGYFVTVSDQALDRTLARVAPRYGLSVSALRKRLTIRPDDADEFLLSVTADKPATAQFIAANVMTGFIETAATMQREPKPADQTQSSFSIATAMSEVGGRTTPGHLKPNISGIDVDQSSVADPRAQSVAFLLRNFASAGPLTDGKPNQPEPDRARILRLPGANFATGTSKRPDSEAAAKPDSRRLEVVEAASLPERPTASYALFVTLAGGTMGLLLAFSTPLRRLHRGSGPGTQFEAR